MLEVNRFGEVVQFKMCTPVEGMAPYWVAAYLVGGLLIDTGSANTAREFVAAVAAESGTGRGPELAVNTHYHEDHVGANRRLQERFGTRILASRQAVPLIRKQPPIPDYRAAVWGRPEPSDVEPIGTEVAAEGHLFRVLETPGHSPDLVSLVEPTAGWCFCGDLYTGARPRVAWWETDVAGLISSLRTLAGLGRPPGRLTLFTGPGEVIEDAAGALLAGATYLEGLVNSGREMEAAGLTAEEIQRKLFGGESSFALLTGGEFSVVNLTRSVLAAGRKAAT